VVADLPGLIEGAHEGAGLGDRFLGHFERCNVVLHLIDGTQEDPVAAYKLIRKELKAYGAGLAEKPEVVGLNKIDALDKDAIKEKLAALKRSARRTGAKVKVLALSGAAGIGVDAVLEALWTEIAAKRAGAEEDAA
jgi:GTP-binding protein